MEKLWIYVWYLTYILLLIINIFAVYDSPRTLELINIFFGGFSIYRCNLGHSICIQVISLLRDPYRFPCIYCAGSLDRPTRWLLPPHLLPILRIIGVLNILYPYNFLPPNDNDVLRSDKSTWHITTKKTIRLSEKIMEKNYDRRTNPRIYIVHDWLLAIFRSMKNEYTNVRYNIILSVKCVKSNIV